jgi:hypothetical protein
MAKYRLLTKEELTELKQEFIEYLVVNGITGEAWETLKKEDNEKAEEIVDLFSDVVFEGAMRKINFLVHRSKRELKTFQCLTDRIVLVAMAADAGATVDFTDEAFIKEAVANPPKGLKIYTTSKEYAKQRELELFEMITAGCEISGGNIFKYLSLALADS